MAGINAGNSASVPQAVAPSQAQGGAAVQTGTSGQTAPVAGVESAGSSGAARA